ncbi:hypothetical protein [Falsiroseomonas sp. E2-1-a4]|uniref:hypothetical protein n=1 Tax=Falsiroseomonas sp. E2-1-a4 TaxID=3239299 RepID=UPI003F395B66
METEPARGRVDPTLFLLATPDRTAPDFLKRHASLNSQARVPVVLNSDDLQAGASDIWLVRRAISAQLYSRDLFNEQLPLRSDLYFVGRDKMVADLLTSIKQSRNRGLFGLRKTGKTSALFKVRRLAERDRIVTLYYDCKDPEIRSMRWNEFLVRIMSDLRSRGFSTRRAHSGREHVSGQFKRLIAANSSRGHVCIIFDEIEYVSPLAKLDIHWHKDFVPFWQTLWTTQSESRTLSFLISGVNPTVVELDEVDGVQNPVFGIVSADYLTGLSSSEVKMMLEQIGKRMGLVFGNEAVSYIVGRYGGHPLLTRMACSYMHTFVQGRGQGRPANITEALLKSTEQDREDEISFYCRHVISELRQFYPDEYQVLEMLSSGNVAGFLETSKGADHVKHIVGYGLIDGSQKQKPTIKLPVVSRFINIERARRSGTSAEPYIVPEASRAAWLQTRIARITADMRQMERLASTRGYPFLYGENGFPEAERFNSAKVVSSRTDFESFVNICNRCFVDPIERHWSSKGIKQYFWNDVKTAYPELWHALLRIKLYRNDNMHLELTQVVEQRLRDMLAQDFLGTVPNRLDGTYFALQQFVLNGLFVGAQIELDKLI